MDYTDPENPVLKFDKDESGNDTVPSGTSFFYDLDNDKAYFKGDVYANNGYFKGTVNATGGSFTGAVTCTSLNCTNATVTGLTVGDNVAMGSNAKISWSNVTNQPDIVSEARVTAISQYEISTATISADQVSAGSFYMTGGSISINTSSEYSNVIVLNSGDFSSKLSPITMKFSYLGSNSVLSSQSLILTDSSGNRTNIRPGFIQIGNYEVVTEDQLSGYYTDDSTIYANRVYIENASNISGDPNARLATSSPHQIGYASGSSRKFKHDIKPVENVELDPTKLYDIEVVQFKYNEDYLDTSDQRYNVDCIGFIAEQVNEVYPIAADCETGEPRNWEMRYMIPPMLALIQEQKKEIDELREKIDTITAQ